MPNRVFFLYEANITLNIAIISFHGCPVARLGEKDVGGMNVYVLNVAKQLACLGHSVDVFTRTHDESDPLVVDLNHGSRVIHVRAGPVGAGKNELTEYVDDFVDNVYEFQEVNRTSYDLIHSHYWLSGIVASRICDSWNIPLISTFHTLAKTKLRARPGEKESKERIFHERQIMDISNGILVLSLGEVKDIENLYDFRSNKIDVISAGVDTKMFYPVEKENARLKLGINELDTLLYVGRIEPIKGLDLLLDTLDLLGRSRDVQLFIVGGKLRGDPELDRLRKKTSDMGLADRVFFEGSVDQETLKNYYSAADVFVLPSFYESFGLAALEALSCGLPVVAARVGGLPSFIDNGVNGYLIPWRCSEPYAEKIEVLLSNSHLRTFMSKAAFQRAQQMSWRNVALKMDNYYESFINSGYAKSLTL